MKFAFAIALAAVTTLSAAPALAGPARVGATTSGQNGWANSDHASANACFGQARGWFASTMGQGTNPYYPDGGTSNGDVISQRAQDGTNVDNNAGFIDQYCGVSGQ